MPRFSGVIRVHKTLAKLETRRGRFTLNPYPKQAPLSAKTAKGMGKNLFGYLDGEQVEVSGTASGDMIYGAHLVTSEESIQDVQIAPESRDAFAQDIEQYFMKDSAEIAVKLNDAGIRTISALYHRIRNNYAEEIRVFSKYLKVPDHRIEDFLHKLESDASSEALVRASPRFPVKRGVNLQLLSRARGVPVTKKAPGSPPKFPDREATPGLPSTVDLLVHSTPVKNQGMRGTCVAHTAVACLEAEYIKGRNARPTLDLSEQYLYWACKNIDGAANQEGTFLEYAVEVLLRGVPDEQLTGGVCTERHWPYKKEPVQNNESQGPPPAPARKALAKNPAPYRALKYSRVKHRSIRALKEALAQGHCVGLSVYTYHFWTDDFAWREGVISMPLGIEPDGAHAICLVGYQDDDADHRDGYFIFKNSWDTTWGYGRPKPGYGSLPYRYVLKEAIEAYTVGI
jgi:C1A family cysteine protease